MKSKKFLSRIVSLGAALALTCSMFPMPALQAEEAAEKGQRKEAGKEAGRTDGEAKKESGQEEGTGERQEEEAEEEIVREIVEINTEQDFLAFAEECSLDSWSLHKLVRLNADLDLSDVDFGAIQVFAGTFDGQGHTISGFRYSGDGYVAGLFRYIEKEGTVENLTLKGEVPASDEKECIGGLCGVNYGTIANCSFQGNVSGKTTVGGLAGVNEGTGIIRNSFAGGRVTGYYSTGGVAGKNHGIVSSCINRACINNDTEWVEEDDQMGAGLFLSINISDSGAELFSGVDTGGIAGYSDGMITGCMNYGKIGYEHTGYNIGGIAGRQCGVVSSCINMGSVYGRKDVGGIVGQMEPYIEIDEAQSLRNAVNKLHDLIEKTIDDMENAKNAVKEDLDDLVEYSDGAADAGDALAEQIADFADANLEQTQAMTDRLGHVTDMLPAVFDDVFAAEDRFAEANRALLSMAEELKDIGSVGGEYNETDYSRLALLSTVGGNIWSMQHYPNAGDTVHILAEPEEGYFLRELKVTDAGGGSIGVQEEGDGKYTFVMPEPNVRAEAYFGFQDAPEDDGNGQGPAAPVIKLSSNLSGNASCKTDGATATLTVFPDGAYTVSGTPSVTISGQLVPVERAAGSEYAYTFGVKNGDVCEANIVFGKQDKSQAVGSAKSDIDNAVKEQQAAAEKVNAIIQEIQSSGSASQEQLNELTKALEEMSGATSAVLSNLSVVANIMGQHASDKIESIGDDMTAALGHLQDAVDSVKEASKEVRGIVDYVNGQPDIRFSKLGGEFDVNRESLHGQLKGMSASIKNLSNNASDYTDVVNDDLRAVNNQINIIFNLLADNVMNYGDISVEELYEEVDVEDTSGITTGKTDSCTNRGIIQGDINVGGIAGAMSIDEEDPEDSAAGSIDYRIGQRYFTKCIITGSVNEGYITAKKDGAGGIVGYMRHGIVVDSEGYGGVESTEGDYVGGICGESFTLIKRCYALCSVSGGKNVGGIAGFADTLKDCYAIADCQASIGKMGAIAGQTVNYDDALNEEEVKVSGNYYVGDYLYGIDNISYVGVAEPISYEELLTVPNLPTQFRHLKVTFRVDDLYLGEQEVKFGESLAGLKYPAIPGKEGYYGVWPDYSEKVMTGNLLVSGEYKEDVTVVQSDERYAGEAESQWEKPYALVEQRFTEDTVLKAVVGSMEPPERARDKEYVIYDIALENAGIGKEDIFAIRLYNPYEDAEVWGYRDGRWTELECKARGGYLQVDMVGDSQSFCVLERESRLWMIIAWGAGGLAVLAMCLGMVKKLKSKAGRKKG